MEISVNFWAVLLAAIVNMAVGFAWYGPLFGKFWKRLMGFTDESMKSMPLSAAQASVGGFITALIMAYVLGHFVNLVDATGLDGAWQLAFWIWLGFQMTVSAGSFLWEGKPLRLFLLNSAEQLVAMFLMAVILVLWR
ncbi:MAG: DUF1761 domain-containing protein [bacterium]|nr:DUF1761 domain-containing protein [bacterium]